MPITSQIAWSQPDQTPSSALQRCLQHEVLKPENTTATVAALYRRCEQVLSGASTGPQSRATASEPAGDNTTDETVENVPAADVPPALNPFFRPYKDNYITFGRAWSDDGTKPFSGEQLDIKYEIGLAFNPFDEFSDFDFLTPLGLGYSQTSWWNIAETSSPFAEHRYNPEVFWRFDQPSRPLVGSVPFIDQIGVEHESNGWDGARSRSWDRIYVQKEYALTSRLSADIKLWDVIGDETNNMDIIEYLGNAEVTLKYRPNDRTRIRLKLLKGSAVSKYSYQLDISYHRPWLNSAFFITYYDGYGEALITYNRKTRSLRAGLYFPVDLFSR